MDGVEMQIKCYEKWVRKNCAHGTLSESKRKLQKSHKSSSRSNNNDNHTISSTMFPNLETKTKI